MEEHDKGLAAATSFNKPGKKRKRKRGGDDGCDGRNSASEAAVEKETLKRRKVEKKRKKKKKKQGEESAGAQVEHGDKDVHLSTATTAKDVGETAARISNRRRKQQESSKSILPSGTGSSSTSNQGGSSTVILVQSRLKKCSADAARPSVLVQLADPEFGTKFKALFEEHVEGFTGLRGSKRVKSEKELGMEWRVRLKAKQEELKKTQSADNQGKGGKTSSKTKRSKAGKESKILVSDKVRQDAINRYKMLKQSKGNSGFTRKGMNANTRSVTFL